MSRYFEAYESWKRDPEAFWAEAATEIDWVRPPEKIFDPSQGQYGRWFEGGPVQHRLQLPRPACRSPASGPISRR